MSSTPTSTTYTYTKTIKNVNLLMSSIQNLFGKQVENFDYNIATSEITVTFEDVLSDADKLALDVLINIYVDTTILTSTDVLSLKYIRVYKSADQNLLTTLNSVNDILFQSSSHIDRWFYQMGYNHKFVYIQKPGLYFIFARVGAHLLAGGVPGTNSVLQWVVSYDDVRAEMAYLPIINSAVYTTHTNLNHMTDTSTICCILNVTSATGTNIKLTAKLILGNSPLTVDFDQTNLAIMSLPGVSYYEGNMTTALTLNATTPSNINFNSNRVVQYPFTHTVGQPNVTITQPGYVLIFAKATFNKTVGTDASVGAMIVRQNGVEIPNAGLHSHAISAVSNKTTNNVMLGVPVAAGDVISMQAQIVSGTSLQATAGEAGVVLLYVNANVLPKLTLGSFSSDGLTPLVTNVPVDMAFNLKNSAFPPSGVSVDYQSSPYSITTPGMYLITCNTTFTNTSGIVREGGVFVSTSVDGGKTYYYVPGALGIKQISGTGKTTVTCGCLVNLPQNCKIKIFSASNGLETDNILITNYTNVLIVNFDRLTEVLAPGGFGSKFGMMGAPEDQVISSTTYVEKCRLVSHDLFSGIYRLGTSIGFVTTAQTAVNIQILDINSTLGTTNTAYTKSVAYPAGTHYFNSIDFLHVTQGSHVFILQISSPGAVAVTARHAQLETWCVG